MDDSWFELVSELEIADSVAVITGAGISAESGISTFRGDGGHWRNHSAEDLASPEGFRRDPDLVWDWYMERRQQVFQSKPNPGHYALVELAELVPKLDIITQNVDGLHQLAGSRSVIPIHGSIWEAKCLSTGAVFENRSTIKDSEGVPKCKCGGMLRPNVLWFGESYDTSLKGKTYDAVSQANVILAVGTSGAIWIVSDLLNKAYTKYKAEFNTEKTMVSRYMDKSFYGPSGRLLPELVKLLKWKKGVS